MKKYKKKIAKVLCLLFLTMLLLSTIVLGESTVEKIENGKLYSLGTMAEVYKTPPGVTIVDSMYSGAVSAPNLKHIIISKGVTEIGSFFFYGVTCNLRNLESIEMADTVHTIGTFTLASNKKLKKVDLSANLKTIEDNAFESCVSLESIILPEGLKTIGREAFRNCDLRKLEIPGSIKKLEPFTFSQNVNLEEVKINKGVEELDYNVFSTCRLRKVYIPSSVKRIHDNAFENQALMAMTIYTPAGSYAEQFAKEKRTRLVLTDEDFNIPKVEDLKIIYSKPVDTRKENIVFGPGLNPKSFVSGIYDVEIWDKDTELCFQVDKRETFSAGAGYFIKINGELHNFNPSGFDTSIPTEYGEIDNYTTFKVGFPAVKELKDREGNIYRIDSDEIYGEVSYTHRKIDEVAGLDHQYTKRKMIKFNTNTPAVEETIAEEQIAKPTTSKVLVNGQEVAFEAYTIEGNNYFKLRDLAEAVKGTNKQFEVTWDDKKKAINLISGKPYISVGSELLEGDGKEKPAALNKSVIYIDGKEADITAYIISGNNYFKLRDIGQAFDINIGWNGNTNTIIIDTFLSYEDKPSTESEEILKIEEEVVRLVNIEREKGKLAPFTADAELSDIASLKSQDMWENDYFDHTSPTYSTPFEMLKHYGIKYMSAGENIALDYKTAEDVVVGWMNSPGHRANIMNPSFNKIGVGLYKSQAQGGKYYWTQMFTD